MSLPSFASGARYRLEEHPWIFCIDMEIISTTFVKPQRINERGAVIDVIEIVCQRHGH